jgi:hypothetical protein
MLRGKKMHHIPQPLLLARRRAARAFLVPSPLQGEGLGVALSLSKGVRFLGLPRNISSNYKYL